MTTLKQVQQDLAHLDSYQLQQVANFIQKIKAVNSVARKLTDFYGVFPAQTSYPGKENIRQSVTNYLAQKHNLGND